MDWNARAWLTLWHAAACYPPRVRPGNRARSLIAPALAMALMVPACQSGNAGGDVLSQELVGKGILSLDETPPQLGERAEAPQWRAGTRLVFRRGSLRTELVSGVGPDGGLSFELDGSGRKQHFGPQLEELGLEIADGSRPLRLDPGDPWLHFPLWPGKRWSAHFVSRTDSRPAVPIEARYHCDAVEEITTPAGRFHCFRIWRTSRVAEVATSKERTSLYWYAPAVGFVVRRLDDGELLELIEYSRG